MCSKPLPCTQVIQYTPQKRRIPRSESPPLSRPIHGLVLLSTVRSHHSACRPVPAGQITPFSGFSDIFGCCCGPSFVTLGLVEFLSVERVPDLSNNARLSRCIHSFSFPITSIFSSSPISLSRFLYFFAGILPQLWDFVHWESISHAFLWHRFRWNNFLFV